MSALSLATAEIEKLICDPVSLGSLDDLMPRVSDAWSSAFPDLSSLPKFEGEIKPLQICVATEDIVGPVRNGGIGTTYAALAEMLAQLGHKSTILYLRGHDVENGTVEEWVAHYAEKGVKFVPVPNYAGVDRFQTGADRWLNGPYNMLRYLLENPMDVVHVSEWRGSAYLSLLAKRQGLAFADTLFVVKTSSPWLWNRIYGSQPLDRLEDLAKIHAERSSVELADMVIGGSLHLLKWMASQGYRVPRQRTFVQPNIATFEHLRHLVERRAAPGVRAPIDEFVFFGRLESRKGLLTFCQAVKRLIRADISLPHKISFLGKPGARLTSRPDQEISDFIRSETSSWPCEIEILPNFQQVEALQYLLGGARLAVMPSLIENSSMAVYEAVICGIPFIASNSGGTPELVHADDRSHVLCDAHPVPLSAKLAEACGDGAYIARPSFDNDDNLATWRRFHTDLGRGLARQLLQQAAPPAVSPQLTAAVCIYFHGDVAQLDATLKSLNEQEVAPASIVIAVDGSSESLIATAGSIAKTHKLDCQVIDVFDLDAGLGFNKAAEYAKGDYILFIWAGVTLHENALRALLKVAGSSSADLVNFFYRVVSDEGGTTHNYLKAHIIGSITEAFFRTDIESIPLMIKAGSFREIGGFSSDYRVVGHDHELVAKALVMGLKCETVLLDLGTVPAWDEAWLYRECYDRSSSLFRAIRPQLAAVPLAIRELLLMSKGLQIKPLQRVRAPGVRAAKKAAAPPKSYLQTMMATFISDVDEAPSKPAPQRQPAAALASRQERLASRLIDNGADDDGRKRPASEISLTSSRPRKVTRPDASKVIGIYKGRIYGYAFDEGSDTEAIEVCLMDGPNEIDRQRARLTIPSVYKGRFASSGFMFDLRSLMRWHKRVKPWGLTVCEAGTQAAIGSVLAPGIDRRLATYGLQGYCDLTDGPVVRGWVWTPHDPKKTLDVSIFVDGRFLTKVPAAAKRVDLEQAGIGHGNFGFSAPVPRDLRDGRPHDIDVVVSRLGLRLTRGKLKIEGDRLSYR